MSKKIRMICILLCLVMLVGLIPTKVFADDNVITHANVTITKPVGGENPDYNPVSSEPNKYYAEVDGWSWMFGHSVTPIGGGSEFKKLERYCLRIVFHPKLGYSFSEDCVFTINGEKTGCYALNGNEFRQIYLYAADPQCPTYTVSFDTNGGSGTMTDVTGVFDYYELPWCTFTPPEGKFFNGWSVDGYLKDPGDDISILKDTILRAGWKDIPVSGQGYTVSFDSNGGTGTMTGKTDFYGAFTLPECSFTAPNGRRFVCWMVNGDGVLRNPGDKINVTLNARIAAIWEDIPIKDYSIYSARVTITPPKAGVTSTAGNFYTNDRYSVSIGWSTTADGSNFNDFNNKTFVAGKTYYADLYLVSQDPYKFADGAAVLVNDVGYTSVWTVGESYKEYIAVYDIPFTVPNSTYSVSFNASGGTGNMAEVSGVFGNYELPDCGFIAPAGKLFKCWALGSTSGAQYNVGEVYNVTKNSTFYAIWMDAPALAYKISASAGSNGSISPSGNVEVAKGGSQTFNITAKSGYHIQDVKVDGKSVGKVSSYTFKNVTSNATISVEFAVDTAPHVCKPTLVPKIEPDCINSGKRAYYHCECGKNYEDEKTKTGISIIEAWGGLNALGHNASSSWITNDNSHWKECTRCDGQWLEKSAHTDSNNDKACDICGYNLNLQEMESESKTENKEDTSKPTDESMESTENATEDITTATDETIKEDTDDTTKPNNSETTETPSTDYSADQKSDGDNDNRALKWIIIGGAILLIVGGVVGFVVIKKQSLH